MINLSTKQEEIVKAPIGNPMQVLASAGSGKTRVLTERIRFILSNTKKDGVIALTFTNKAAEEMHNRLIECDDIEGRAWVATVHSVAQRILEQYGHTIGLPNDLHIYDRDKDRMEVFLQSLRDEGVDIDEYLNIEDTKEQRNRERNLQRYMDGFSQIKREMLSEEEIGSRYPDTPTLWKVFQDYQHALINSGGIDYDDILVYAHKVLLTHEWIANVYRAKYKHVCVDEAQDLNRAQYEFIKVLCGESITSLLMVGDPNQMIYGFNGSSTDFLCKEFIHDFSPTAYTLKENFRSTKAVIRAANKLKPNSQNEHEFALDGGLAIEEFQDEESEAMWICSTIKHLLDMKQHAEIEGNISLEKMVIIGRNRFVFQNLEEQLRKESISYTMRKGERSSESASLFGKTLDYGIRIKLNPKDWVDGKKLCKLLKLKAPESWGGGGLLATWSNQLMTSTIPNAELFKDVLSAIDELDSSTPNIRKFVRDMESKLKAIAEQDPLDNSDNGNSRVEELKRSIDELAEFGACWTRFKRKALGDSLSAFRNAMALGQLTEEASGDGITLSTVHTMKGLEKDIVFLMGMCEGVFPDYRANTNKKIEEEKNSAFVAVTRAKRWLYITNPRIRVMPWGDSRSQQRSRFVTEILK
ncbi:ATP-dependent helicase [Mariprofundus ferrooxydans]|uniref:ATP-dependent helicase n=1 Tax=Mariprofundus ferrooxydans TaxID=314344 RepID=UPI00143103FB|nr:ATP-dependent helicase [Mariprofundus ferrooxydans]